MSDVLALVLVANGLLMIAIPVVIALALRRTFHPRWALLFGGALAFIGAQVIHLPILSGMTWLFSSGALPRPTGLVATLFDPLVLGFLAAACEEPARALLFARFFRGERRSADALMAGAGHGGIEAVILGALVLLTLVNMVASRDLTAEQLGALGVPADQAATALEQIRAYWSTPWTDAILGAVERGIAMSLHLACSVLVMEAVRARRVLPFVIAFAAHWATDATAVLASRNLGAWATEGVLAALVLPFAIAVIARALRADRVAA